MLGQKYNLTIGLFSSGYGEGRSMTRRFLNSNMNLIWSN